MFINLSREDRQDIIKVTAQKMKVDPVLVEKDWWVIQTLNHLFLSPFADHLTFKGGTSLSKAYQLINRFSEDIDITIHKQFLDPDFDMSLFHKMSRKKRDTLLKNINIHAHTFIKNTILPYLQNNLPFSPTLKISENDPLSIEIYYDSVLFSQLSYIQSRVYVEFGFRGSINPSEIRHLQSYIRHVIGDKIDPLISSVSTLSPIKTFFEKATLLHAEYNRSLDKITPLRLSRHCYDLFQMHRAGILEKALTSYNILNEVIHHKDIFFSSGWVDYLSILEKGIHIQPHPMRINEVKKDYEETKIMILGDSPNFRDIMISLNEIEIKLNEMIKKEYISSSISL